MSSDGVVGESTYLVSHATKRIACLVKLRCFWSAEKHDDVRPRKSHGFDIVMLEHCACKTHDINVLAFCTGGVLGK